MTKVVAIVVSAVCVVVALTGTALGAGSSEGRLFESTLVGSVPNTVIAGVPSGGAPWTVASSEVRLRPDGELRVKVRGLLLINTGNPALDGTTGPVRAVRASLVCANAVVDTTASVPLNARGDAEIRETITAPRPCFAPAVLVRIGATTTATNLLGPWIAATGF
jgi:hypothetical protein